MSFKISTHTPLAGCNVNLVKLKEDENISTHTPLAGCNNYAIVVGNGAYDFYSHTPCGVQQLQDKIMNSKKKFLLTHPLRGATAK